jgi:aspartyl-tRNA(Asn)/glutamyl-tRNA(Gln) amidotransferase subunit A
MAEMTALTIAEIRDGLAAKQFSALELTDAYLAAIEAANPLLNAYIVTTPERAREMARASDERIGRGEARALDGVPLGIKDLFCTEGVHSQAASHILDGFKPRYESTVTANLWADGAVMLGKLNMDEFAMGSSNETSFYGPVVNPWRRGDGGNTKLVPGGSSGGSAAAVAAQLCAGATATDTGGSIRQPAAFTGTVGIKPTYGRCSRWGIVAFASSLDQAGPIARTGARCGDPAEVHGFRRSEGFHSAEVEVPDYERRGRQRARPEAGHPARIPHGRHARRDRAALAAGHRVVSRGRGGDRRHLAAAHQIRAAGLLHRGAGGGLVQPRPL